MITNEPNGLYSARYIRYTGANAQTAYVGITEFEVFGLAGQPLPQTIGAENRALRRAVIPHSNVVVGDPAFATDGDFGTRRED